MTSSRFFLTVFVILFSLHGTLFGQRYELIWSEEFDGGSLLDNWTYQIGTTYNNELQYYTQRDTNVFQKDGFLYLVGLRENYGGRNWTSGRLRTENKFEFQHGKVEIRAKLPAARGMWPAFWMLGSNIDQIGWPYCGEIDIMEYRGHITNQTNGTIHFSAVSPEQGNNPVGDRRYIGESYTLPEGDFSTDFHLFQFEWTDSLMIWFIDDVEYFRISRTQILGQTSYYPFDQPFYLILNLAIGGDYLGEYQPDASTPDRNELIVDYVRVFQDANQPPFINTGLDSEVHILPYQTQTITPEITDVDGTVESVNFYINEQLIGTANEAPYSVNWQPTIDGCYTLKIIAKDNEHRTTTNTATRFVVGSGCTHQPFHEQPAEFPGILQLEHYDYGGLGIAYNDHTPDTNLGNAAGNDFRPTEAVDIIPDSEQEGNYLLTEIENGEWTLYTITVTQSGLYDIELGYIGGEASGRIDFELNGEEEWLVFNRLIKQDTTIKATKLKTNVALEEGTHQLKMMVALQGFGLELDYLKATLSTATSIETDTELPTGIRLLQNYPNPFNPTTAIQVVLQKSERVSLAVYNTTGQQLRQLYSGLLTPGSHTFTFDASGLSSGVYYYQLSGAWGVITRKMVLLK